MRFCSVNKQRPQLIPETTTRHKRTGHKDQRAGKIQGSSVGFITRDQMICIRLAQIKSGIPFYFARIRIDFFLTAESILKRQTGSKGTMRTWT
jgi:hypothetical protein